MKIRHHVRNASLKSDPVSPEYQAEVDRSTNKAQVAWERAKRKLLAAERRLALADAKVVARAALGKPTNDSLARECRIAAELVELRREELQFIENLMQSIPGGGSQHRGRGTHRPVPQIASGL